MRHVTTTLALVLLTACGNRGPELEARTFELRYIDAGNAEQMIRPYVYSDRAGAKGELVMSRGRLSVRETPDNLDRIARVLAEHDKPPANMRLVFQVIRANGAGPRDSSIAEIEEELRRLFRFTGYRLVAEGVTTVGPGAPCRIRLDGEGGPYHINGQVGQVTIVGDSGSIQLQFALDGPRGGGILQSDLTLGLGRTVVVGGQRGNEPGAVILAVRTERAN